MRRAIVSGCQGQQAAGLGRILGPASRSMKPGRVKVSSEWDGHGEAPLFATLNQSDFSLGIPCESCSRGLGISLQLHIVTRHQGYHLAQEAAQLEPAGAWAYRFRRK